MTKTRIGGVYKHPSGGYIARLRFRGVSTSKTFSSMASAERWMNQTKGGLETGDVVVYQGNLVTSSHGSFKKENWRASSLDRFCNPPSRPYSSDS